MSRWTRTAFGLSLLGALLTYDSSSRIHAQPAAPTPTEPNAAAFERFNSAHGGKWRVEWNRVTGSPHRLSGSSFDLTETVTEQNAEAVARKVVETYRELLKVDPTALVLKSATADRPQGAPSERSTWRVAFRQVHGGVPVEGGNVRLAIRGRRVTSMGSDFFPNVDAPASAAVPRDRAVRSVQADLRVKELKPVSVELLVLPRPRGNKIEYPLVWSIVTPAVKVPRSVALPDEGHGQGKQEKKEEKRKDEALLPAQWRYAVHAVTGQIIERRNIMVYDNITGDVTGLVHPLVPADTAVTDPIAHMRVTATQGMTTVNTETDAAGHYVLTGLAAGAANLTAHLTGTHVESHNNETTDPDATHTSAVTAAGTHNWTWDPDDPSPGDVQTHAFYHVNSHRDWFLRGDPFNLSPLPDPMEVYVRDGAYCNAGAGSDGLYFGNGDGTCQDFGLCTDIIYHEYTHRIFDKAYADAGVSTDFPHAGAMNEATADYFAVTRTNDPNQGGGCYSGRNVDTPDKRYPDNWTGEVHEDGRIFVGALWDLRTVLGAPVVDSLAIRALKQGAASFQEYLGAVLEEDDDPLYNPSPLANNNLADGSPNIDAICHAYYDTHGIYNSHCSGHTQTAVAQITSPPPMDFNLLNGSSPTVTIVGTALGAATAPFSNFTLDWAPESTPTTFSTAGLTLTGGGTAPVNDATLGTLNIAALADGFYIVRLTVTAGAVTATAKTHFVIDRHIMAGWPQKTDERFYGSPAVAELDSSAAGKEIVAHSTWGNVYVFHADGTVMTGWPRYAGYTQASPAVGDLDGDGTLEVVVANYGGTVYAFHSNGTTVTGWPQSCGTQSESTPALADLDGDGKLEVVLGSQSHQICAWHADGTPVAGWPVATTDEVASSAAVGDVDLDGLPEVVVGSKDGKVYALRGNGTALPGWPVTVPAEVSASPALGDIDGDGDLEIVVGAKDMNVYAWQHNGTPVAGWPKTMTQFVMAPSSPALADLDGDGALDVMVMSNDDRIQAWHGDGTPIAGWPPASPGFGGYEFVVSSPVIGDIDGDGNQDVVVDGSFDTVDTSYVFKVHGFHNDATPLAGWPKIIGSYSNSSPALADVNGDGGVDVVIGSRGVYVWSLPGAYSDDTMEWPFYRHDIRRTGTYGPKAGVVLLFDTSGSMSWRHDGTMGVPVEEQRITKAKEATYPFLEMLNDFNAGKARFGIATFPNHPTVGCNGQVVTPMTLVNDTSKTTAVGTTIPGLTTSNSTPLLAGVGVARTLFGAESRKALVLLSDGYHNCPSMVTPADPSVTGLISQLNTQGIRVFTIGFGQPTDVDHPLLEAFASQTTPPGFPGSQFHDVTTASFDPLTWDPATDLQATYKAILVDALGLQSAMDPLAILNAGATLTRTVRLNEYDRRVSFYLSWVTSRRGRLSLALRSSDGAAVPARGAGVRVHQGNTYTIVTVDSSFLRQAGKVGATPWTIAITGPGMQPGDTEKLQYSVIVDSALRLRPSAGTGAAWVGDKLQLSAQLTAAGHPVPGLTTVSVAVTRPKDGRGNWIVKNTVTAAQLARVPLKRGTEPLSLAQRRVMAISDVLKVPYPTERTPVETVRLYDDGTHGDAKANDGFYTADFADTKTDGTYAFHFTANGPTKAGNGFDRDGVVQKYLKVRPASEHSRVKVVAVGGRVKITVTPRDAAQNFLGPGHAAILQLTPSRGRVSGPIRDNGDGTYSQWLVVPKSVNPKDVTVRLDVRS